MRRRVIIKEEGATVAAIGTVLLVVLVVALMTVVGLFAYGLVKFPEDPPKLEVVYNQLNDQWTVHISDVSEDTPLSEFRLVARHEDGSYVLYDDDRDATADALLAVGLEDLLAGGGGGAQAAPLVFIDVDGDGAVSSGDVLIAHSVYVPDDTLLMDSTRGNKQVGQAPHGIPADSDLTIVVGPNTLPLSGVNPGDVIHIEVMHGSTVEAMRDGTASAAGTFISNVYLDPVWHRGNHKVDFTIRPGEIDEWFEEFLFKLLDPDPPTPAEIAQYDQISHPLRSGDVISLIHEPTGTTVLEFRL